MPLSGNSWAKQSRLMSSRFLGTLRTSRFSGVLLRDHEVSYRDATLRRSMATEVSG